MKIRFSITNLILLRNGFTIYLRMQLRKQKQKSIWYVKKIIIYMEEYIDI